MKDRILSIDPGNEESAFVIYDGFHCLHKGKVDNYELLDLIRNQKSTFDFMAIEMVASYGMPVGKEVFETCVWIGRFTEACVSGEPKPWIPIFRKQVKLFHCGAINKVKDSHIRQVLIDKYGKPGSKKDGYNPIYNDEHVKLVADMWSAFAIATYLFEYANQFGKVPFDKFEFNLQ